jgi:predicted  nucleic acid-binding Zn-ribbon protein
VFAGFSAAPGILSFGKELGEKAKRVKEAKDKKHALLKELKSIDNDIKTITALNTDVIEAVNRINKLHAGALTAEQQIRYDSYEAQQKALKARTDEIELEVNSLNTIINDSGGVLNG